MTNFEKYHEEMIKNGYTAVKNGKPASCGIISCEECYCFEEGDCNDIALLEWLAEEYEEPKPMLTKHQRALCEAIEYGWIARDDNKYLYWYSEKPIKRNHAWYSSYPCFHIAINLVLPDLPFITWEDEEPHSIEEMLTWEVKE